MDSRDMESEVYAEEHAPPSYYGGGDVPYHKQSHGAPLISDPPVFEPNHHGNQQYQMQPITNMPRHGDQVTVVAMAPKDGEGEVYGGVGYGYCHLVCSFISFFLCTFCGMIALVCAMLGYSDFRTGNMKLYKKKRSCAIGWIFVAWLSAGGFIGLLMYLKSRQMYIFARDKHYDPYDNYDNYGK